MRQHDELPPPGRRVGVREAARLLGVHVGAVYRWLRRGKLGAWTIGGRYVLDHDEVLAFPRRSGPETVGQGVPQGHTLPSHAEAAALLRQRGFTV